ncbi:UDP-N-acetylmuramoyl-L-alanyl-D-glutamate--2,6-diaminopimelate ligase [Cereibacter sphaeroides]|uniref:UDP-N-acetylmuramoyl-L-alanyl-D-glutamate--2, 6-diaminopimelate ligase n=1 Tax=Cereibacter sphaeroides TaxID=1063 RepID=UPI001F208DDC|nr:UDP-N-acetylmuramoyl-L-alanyl-D-glutamate--2,6-diaminopimelate ligase [Cereibacter sphaeroides]MCE6960277.1 UDP-N-acetylmuramoyl-L-alanyl-D-glutamate--2,6-diaminopimelate ligase [Cereibacter sphaeroides]MCE6969172.1 UDP-N-acetylmuramoyl-L-alanyl-D-glutamate--2,6-diaminopimelate ligase [Cereibacter sphaeroides]MCE6974888.1 UDP-N-acetylmuramoyl-L-alanyl-D-glutamate--2,6-diaminopimelate ligase [Cereibacter sphaeroides]
MADRAGTLSALGLTAAGGRGADVAVTGLAVDSRQVRPGFLFAALPGSRVHGASFVPAALAAGAGAILTDAEGAALAREALERSSAALVVAEDPRQALAGAAALWFGRQPGTMVAVTGTNGKTSVATFTRQIWTALGHAAINIGTTGVEGAYAAPSSHTTPEPITLHRLLSEAAAAGVTHAAMEASSHGLEQRRLDGVQLKAAGFTNFTQDHLDYHETFEAYFDAKAGLFTRVLPDDAVAVVNLDDPKGAEVAALARDRGQRVIGTGFHQDAELRLLSQRFDATGQDLRFSWQGKPHLTRLPLIGGFQAWNVAVAAGLAIGAGAEPERVFATFPQLQGVRGRMQLAATRANGASVFVDYAHTPDALATALRALRPHVMGRIIVVFGAGGDRDRGKRPLMGRAAAEHADVLYVTDDNPRSENPAVIRAAILEACPEAHEVGDRAEAILRGVDALTPGDALLIAGKGHESGQIIGTDIFPFDDAEQASIATAALDGLI